MASPVASLTGVRKFFPGVGWVLDGINLDVEAGSSVAIVGRSGSGKSTLLSVLALLDSPDAGDFELAGRNIRSCRTSELDRLRGWGVSLVFQRFGLLSHLSALENVLLPLRHRGRQSERSMKKAALSALESVDMQMHTHKHPRDLSGGEQQRIAIARALVTEPSLILADEPTGALDAVTGDHVVDLLLTRTSQSGAALVVVTHDHMIAARADRALRLESGTLHPLGCGS